MADNQKMGDNLKLLAQDLQCLKEESLKNRYIIKTVRKNLELMLEVLNGKTIEQKPDGWPDK